jgi:hypothetical protein
MVLQGAALVGKSSMILLLLPMLAVSAQEPGIPQVQGDLVSAVGGTYDLHAGQQQKSAVLDIPLCLNSEHYVHNIPLSTNADHSIRNLTSPAPADTKADMLPKMAVKTSP